MDYVYVEMLPRLFYAPFLSCLTLRYYIIALYAFLSAPRVISFIHILITSSVFEAIVDYRLAAGHCCHI